MGWDYQCHSEKKNYAQQWQPLRKPVMAKKSID